MRIPAAAIILLIAFGFLPINSFSQEWSPFKDHLSPAPAQRTKPAADNQLHIACIRANWPTELPSTEDDLVYAARRIRATCFSQLQNTLNRLEKEKRGFLGADYVDRSKFYELWNAAIAVRLTMKKGPETLPVNWPAPGELEVFKSILAHRKEKKEELFFSCLRSKIQSYASSSRETADALARMVLGLCQREHDAMSLATCEFITYDRCTPELRERSANRIFSWHPRTMEAILKSRDNKAESRSVDTWQFVVGTIASTKEEYTAAAIIAGGTKSYLLIRCYSKSREFDLTISNPFRKAIGAPAIARLSFEVDGVGVGEVDGVGAENDNKLRVQASSEDSTELKDIILAMSMAAQSISISISELEGSFSFPAIRVQETFRKALGSCVPIPGHSAGQPPTPNGSDRTLDPQSREFTPSRSAQAPLKIVNAPGANVYWKLVDGDTKVASGFVRQGDMLTALVPFGCFKFRYATGEAWIDEGELFGESTTVFEADSDFCFMKDVEKIIGQQINLNLVRNGNLRVKKLDREKF